MDDAERKCLSRKQLKPQIVSTPMAMPELQLFKLQAYPIHITQIWYLFIWNYIS